MLVLTIPGERIMDPNFGVGLRKYLFELNNTTTYSAISSKILGQVRIYLSYLRIDDIQFGIPENNPDLYPYSLNVSIDFTIKPLNLTETLNLSVGDI